jgi:serine protease Do
MNKVFFAMMPWMFAAIGYKATAQEVREIIVEGKELPKTETREIIVRKKGNKNTTISIEFKDDKVLINGKALVEFKDDEISINNRKIVINGKSMGSFDEMERQFKEMEIEFKNLEDTKVDSLVGNRAFLGVTTEKNENGALIENVTKESAAEKAGLQKGDIISKVNETQIDGPEKLAAVIGKLKPRDEAKITYSRNGKSKTVKATLQERKENETANFTFIMPEGNVRSMTIPRRPAMPRRPDMPGGPEGPERIFQFYEYDGDGENMNMPGFEGRPKLGLKIQDLEEGAGVKVLEVQMETPAAKAGLQKDDIITQIAGVKVLNTDDAREQLSINAEKSSYTIQAKRNNVDMKFEMKIPKKLKTINL